MQDAKVTEDLLEQGGTFMQHLLMQSDDTMEMFTDLLTSTCMAEVGVAALKIANKTHSYEALAWYEIFVKIKHSMTCKNRSGCDYHATPPFLEAARTSLERIAIPTMIALQDDLGSETKYLLLWYDLMKLLGITDMSIRERYRVDKKCCNLQCPARNSGVHSAKKSTCTVCRSVFYCDRACQKSDWPTHKLECEKLAKEAWEDV
ncbi:hypothetical protein BDZ97DRAFT_1182775 [Flammula alnicola]|nr:hypothetical protein BDZ97DRAFT_1182775 [Flammula alnicola]